MKLPTKSYKLRLVLMITVAEEKGYADHVRLFKLEWAATLSGQRKS